MAKPLLNSAFNAISGAIDRWVYRQVNGRTVIARRPEPTGLPPSAAQMLVREQFRQAGKYASDMALDPVQGPAYAALAAARGRPMRALMIADFFHPPVVESIGLGAFHGAVGDPIIVNASDDVGVTAVSVVLRAADSSILEQGVATLSGSVWSYAATQAHPAGTPITITATAVDRPGHTGTLTVTWPSVA